MNPSIVIPLFNRYDLTADCLDNLHADAELILVDNGSTDQTLDLPVTIRNATNLGFAHACNQGAEAASGDVIVFLNNDTIPHAGWLDALCARLEHCDIAGGKLLYPDGSIQHAGISVDFSRPWGAEARNITADLNIGPYEVSAVTGACLAVHASAFTGFDEGYWNGYEDVDLCLQMHDNGGSVWYTPDAVVTHLESQSGPARWTHVKENISRLRAKWGEQ